MAQDMQQMQEEAEEAQEERQPVEQRQQRRASPSASAPQTVVVGGQARLVGHEAGRYVYDVCFRPLQLPAAGVDASISAELTASAAVSGLVVQDPASAQPGMVFPTSPESGRRSVRLSVWPARGRSLVLRVTAAVPLLGARLTMRAAAFVPASPAPCRAFPPPPPAVAPAATAVPMTGTMPLPAHPATHGPAATHGRPMAGLAALRLSTPLFLFLVALLVLALVRCCCCRSHRQQHRAAAAAAPVAAPVAAVTRSQFAVPPPVPLYPLPPHGYTPLPEPPGAAPHLSVYPQHF